jgi:phage-related protein
MAIKFVSRNSIGSYYNSAGLVALAGVNEARYTYNPTNLAAGSSLLIEEQRTNLLTYSEQFDNAAWTKGDVTVTANSVIAPDGTLTADLLTANGIDSYVIQVVPFTALTKFTYSVYLRASASMNISICTRQFPSNTDVVNLDVAVTTEWKRFTITGTTVTGTTSIQVNIGGFSRFITGESVYVWGAQLEQGAFATSYIPSADSFTSRESTGTFIGSNGFIQSAATNVARYNYNPLNLALSPKLLLEPAATNLLTYSEDQSNAVWGSPVGSNTITNSTAISPDGGMTADTLTYTGPSDGPRRQSISIGNNSSLYTVSAYIKQGTAPYTSIALSFVGGTTEIFTITATLRWSDLTIGNRVSNINPSITPVGNGWYRLSVTGANNSTGNTTAIMDFRNQGDDSIGFGVGNENGTSYIWGAQLEVGTTATSYIPTTSAQVTRAADISSSAARTRAVDLTYGTPDYLLPVSTKITIDSSKTVVFSDMAAQFGDGYEQVAAKGINNVRENWSIEWGGLSTTEKDAIVAVLNSVGSWGLLLWTPCGETAQKKYRMTRDGYSVKRESSNAIFTVTCNLRQVFDIT